MALGITGLGSSLGSAIDDSSDSGQLESSVVHHFCTP